MAENLQNSAPLILLYGEEDYLLDKRLQQLLVTVVPEAARDFNQDQFQADEVQSEAVFRLAMSFPVMCDKRLVLLRGLERASAGLLTDLERYAKNPSPSTCMVMCATKIDKRKSVWKNLLKLCHAEAFNRLSTNELPTWMIFRLAEEGIELPDKSAEALSQHLEGASLRMVAGELEKLKLLLDAEQRKTVEAPDLATVLGVRKDVSRFHLADALMARDAKRSTAILLELLQLSQMQFMLLATLARTFGKGWFASQVRDAGGGAAALKTALKLRTDWQAKTILGQIQQWQAGQLARASELIRNADMDLKGGSALPASIRMTQLIVEICRC